MSKNKEPDQVDLILSILENLKSANANPNKTHLKGHKVPLPTFNSSDYENITEFRIEVKVCKKNQNTYFFWHLMGKLVFWCKNTCVKILEL